MFQQKERTKSEGYCTIQKTLDNKHNYYLKHKFKDYPESLKKICSRCGFVSFIRDKKISEE